MKKYVISKRQIISILLNCLIIAFVVTGTVVMLSPRVSAEGEVLASRGWRNLRYFTALSNEFCGIVSILWIVQNIRGKRFSPLLKLMAVAVSGTAGSYVYQSMNQYISAKLTQEATTCYHIVRIKKKSVILNGSIFSSSP